MLRSNKSALIQQLSLIQHQEGGYYNETYRSCDKLKTSREHNGGLRHLSTCIFYMLTDDNPICYFHKNLSQTLHFYHGGGVLTYRFIHPDGKTEKHVLGPDIKNGHKLQLVAPENVWKSTELKDGESFGLVSEVVFPRWEVYDSQIANYADLILCYPQYSKWIKKYSYVEPV